MTRSLQRGGTGGLQRNNAEARQVLNSIHELLSSPAQLLPERYLRSILDQFAKDERTSDHEPAEARRFRSPAKRSFEDANPTENALLGWKDRAAKLELSPAEWTDLGSLFESFSRAVQFGQGEYVQECQHRIEASVGRFEERQHAT